MCGPDYFRLNKQPRIKLVKLIANYPAVHDWQRDAVCWKMDADSY